MAGLKIITMRNKILFLPVIAAFAFLSCAPIKQQTYYISPFNGNYISYHPIPLKADSIPSALYAGVVIYTGTANELDTDK